MSKNTFILKYLLNLHVFYKTHIKLNNLYFIAIVVGALTPVFCAGQSVPEQAQRTPDEIISSVKSYLKSNINNYSGIGSATVTERNVFGDKEPQIEKFSVDFMFQGVMSRSDIKSIPYLPGKIFKPLKLVDPEGISSDYKIWFKNINQSGLFSNGDVLLQQSAFDYYDRQLGRDFHPETFSRVGGFPLLKTLESMEKVENLVCQVNEDGKINIRVSGDGEAHELLLDSKRGFLLEAWSFEGNMPDFTIEQEAKYSWTKYKNHYYIESASYEEKSNQQGKNKVHHKIKVKIDHFSDDVQIDPSKFTLEGLQLLSEIPIRVTDKVSGISYKLKAKPVNEDVSIYPNPKKKNLSATAKQKYLFGILMLAVLVSGITYAFIKIRNKRV